MSNEKRRIRLVTIHRHPSGKNVTGITYCLPDDSQKDPCSKNREGVSESDVMDNYFLGIMRDFSNRVAPQKDIIGFDVKLDNFDKEDKEKLYNLLEKNFKNQDGKPVKIIKTHNEFKIITDAVNNTPSIGDGSSPSSFLVAIGGGGGCYCGVGSCC